jgi:hypothetical protein
VRARAPERFAPAVEIEAGEISPDELGNAVHRFLAADLTEAGQQEQVEIATRLLQAAGAATFV